MKRLLILFFAFFLYGGVRTYYRLTDDFRVSNFISHLPSEKTARIDPLFLQPYTYLGKGAQSYALESEDGRYILKLFKNKHLKPSKTIRALAALPFLHTYCQEHIAKRELKLKTVLEGYQTAYRMHAKESGLMYVHLGETHNLNHKIAVTDKLGRKMELDLDSNAFVIQEKGVKLRTLLNQLLLKEEIALAKKRIDQVLDLYLEEYQKGIYDLDLGVMHNFGFVGEKPIHFDVGKLIYDPHISESKNFAKDLDKVVWKISAWLRKAHPRYQNEIIQEIEQKMTKVLGEPFSAPQIMS